MIKTPLSTMIGGAFWTPCATIIGSTSATLNTIIKALFANNEQGFAYDPNDLTTLYQDAAGTIPVTAAGQPVGLMKDKSGRNNHASQSVSASRPTLSSRVNMLTGTNNLVNWSAVNTAKDGTTVTAIGGTPLNHICYLAFTYVPSSMITYYIEVTKGVGFCFFQMCYSNSNRAKCTINLATGEKVVKLLATNTTTVVVEDGGDVWRLTFTGSATGAIGTAYANMGLATSLTGDTYNSYDEPIFIADGSQRMTIKAIDVRETRIGSNLPKYQRVTSSTDYDSVGFPNYLAFDGVDDFLQTNNIDFTATDEVSLFAGMRKLSDTQRAILCELSIAAGGNTGSFCIEAPRLTGVLPGDYSSTAQGVSSSTTTTGVGAYLSPNSAVITLRAKNSANLHALKVNNLTYSSPAPLGLSNFGNYPFYIGRRAGKSLPFNGHLYSLIGIGRLTTDSETVALEKAIARNTGVTLSV